MTPNYLPPIGNDLTPVTRADLQAWGEAFQQSLESDLIRKLYRAAGILVLAFIASIVGSAVALSYWRYSMEGAIKDSDRRVAVVEQRVSGIDTNGTQAIRGMVRQLDSLSFEVRTLTRAIEAHTGMRR